MNFEKHGSLEKQLPWIAAAVVFPVHAAGNAHYGYFRDELYFIICGFHPQFGYVDQPPIVPLLSAGTQLFGHSLFLLRLMPALFAAAGAYTTCLLVVEFGGGAFAQVLATIVFLFTGVLMSFGMKVSTDTVGLWTWPLLALLLVRIAKGADRRLWLAAGLVAGLTIESKYSVVFLIIALGAGLLITPERRILFDRWCAAGLGVAALVALPNFLWQWHYGFPMIELLQAGQNGKNLIAGPALFLAQQLIITNVFVWPEWAIGFIWLLLAPRFRFLGIAYAVLIAEMIVFHGKHYYPADVYPMLIAAGAVPIERWTRGNAIARGVVLTYALVLGLVFVPFALPVLPESTFVSYQAWIGNALHISRSVTATEAGRETAALPGDWADMHGWPELAAAVKRTYEHLSPNERSRAVVFAGNYGEAAAVEFFDPGIPVISEHNQYYLWGTRGYDGSVLIQVNGSCFQSDGYFTSRTLAARTNDRWAISHEANIPIWVCRGIKKPLAEIWPTIKLYE